MYLFLQQIGTLNTRSGLKPRNVFKDIQEELLIKENQYRRFKDNLDHVLQKHLVQLKNVDLVYLFTLYFLVVFSFLVCIYKLVLKIDD